METQTGKEGVLGLQDLKKYMQKVNHKIPTSTLIRARMQEPQKVKMDKTKVI